ncbi:unnamed protein product, partial [Closterium sp. NIES-54]
ETPNGSSQVTLVEHVEADPLGVPPLFRPIVAAALGFGAARWMAALHHQCVRFGELLGNPTSRDSGIVSQQGRRAMLRLAGRMLSNFCVGLSSSTRHSWKVIDNSDRASAASTAAGGGGTAAGASTAGGGGMGGEGEGMGGAGGASAAAAAAAAMGAVEVWVAMRRSVTGAGEPLGVILNAAASVWLPVPMPLAFEFLRNEQTRREVREGGIGEEGMGMGCVREGSGVSAAAAMGAVEVWVVMRRSVLKLHFKGGIGGNGDWGGGGKGRILTPFSLLLPCAACTQPRTSSLPLLAASLPRTFSPNVPPQWDILTSGSVVLEMGRIPISQGPMLHAPYPIPLASCISLASPSPHVPPQWDILTSGSVVSEMGRIPIGVDHGNCVSLLKVQQAAAGPGAQTNMLILQETTFDPSGALIVYAPVDIPAMKEVISGGSSDSVALLPSGFSLLPDCALSSDQRVALFHAAPVQPTAGGAASAAFAGGAAGNGRYGAEEGWQQGGEVDSLVAQAMRSAARKRALGHVPEGSILTVSFQILVSPNPQAKLTTESMATVNSLICCTVQRIRQAMDVAAATL